jgi:general secretion pathway protein G
MTSIQRAQKQLLMDQNTGTGKSGFIGNPSMKQRKNALRIHSEIKGFTLIEIMIVFTLIGILVAMGIPQFKYAVKRSREATLKEDLFIMRKLLNQYCVDKGHYPASLEALVEEEYLMKIPKDPITRSSETWIEVTETLTEEELINGEIPGVVDVHSGSEEISLDGTPYNTW